MVVYVSNKVFENKQYDYFNIATKLVKKLPGLNTASQANNSNSIPDKGNIIITWDKANIVKSKYTTETEGVTKLDGTTEYIGFGSTADLYV